MVCRLSEEKIIPFALEVLKEVRKKMPDARLVIAGSGPEEEKIREKIRQLGLQDSVTLLGRREDVARLYQAFDVLLMPSIHEGFPVVAVEAMAAGLPILLSASITRELDFYSALQYLPLNGPEPWASAIENRDPDLNRELGRQEVKNQGLDIRDTVRTLEKIYEQDAGEEKCVWSRN